MHTHTHMSATTAAGSQNQRKPHTMLEQVMALSWEAPAAIEQECRYTSQLIGLFRDTCGPAQ